MSLYPDPFIDRLRAGYGAPDRVVSRESPGLKAVLLGAPFRGVKTPRFHPTPTPASCYHPEAKRRLGIAAMKLFFATATESDAPCSRGATHTAVAEDLTNRFGRWLLVFIAVESVASW